MGGLTTLLAEAEAAGLEVSSSGDQLVICGPKDAEPMATRLTARKAEVMAALDWPADIRSEHAPIRHLPAPECVAPIICSRLGRCDRFEAGDPCSAVAGADGVGG